MERRHRGGDGPGKVQAPVPRRPRREEDTRSIGAQSGATPAWVMYWRPWCGGRRPGPHASDPQPRAAPWTAGAAGKGGAGEKSPSPAQEASISRLRPGRPGVLPSAVAATTPGITRRRTAPAGRGGHEERQWPPPPVQRRAWPLRRRPQQEGRAVAAARRAALIKLPEDRMRRRSAAAGPPSRSRCSGPTGWASSAAAAARPRHDRSSSIRPGRPGSPLALRAGLNGEAKAGKEAGAAVGLLPGVRARARPGFRLSPPRRAPRRGGAAR